METASHSIRIEPTQATLGAVVTGCPLVNLDESKWRVIEAAFHEHALLIFPGQHLGHEEQVAFGRRFGEIEHIFGDRGWVPLSNQREDGSLLDDDAMPMQIMRGNEGWHTDSSYMALSAKASILSAHVVPSRGGDTGWADMRAAYEALDEAMRSRVADLSAYHSLVYSQEQIGHMTNIQEFGYGTQETEPPLRPLVKIHPVTGRPALFIGRHAYGIPGVEPEASTRLLQDLLEAACQPPRVYQHAWRPGDIAIWDNRCVLHRARPYDHTEPRVMVHTRIAGDPATESAGA